MKLDEAKRLASKCIKAASEAWDDNFDDRYNSGDNNREAIGRIANTLLKHCLGTERIEQPSETK